MVCLLLEIIIGQLVQIANFNVFDVNVGPLFARPARRNYGIYGASSNAQTSSDSVSAIAKISLTSAGVGESPYPPFVVKRQLVTAYPGIIAFHCLDNVTWHRPSQCTLRLIRLNHAMACAMAGKSF
jgi:hypothetical protein